MYICLPSGGYKRPAVAAVRAVAARRSPGARPAAGRRLLHRAHRHRRARHHHATAQTHTGMFYLYFIGMSSRERALLRH